MPQLVDLKVGFSCNNKCQHCVVSDKYAERDLTLAQIKQIVENYISQYGRIKLTLTGGEVTIRNDYFEIIDYIRKKKSAGWIDFVDIQTNGRRLANDKILQKTIPVVDFYLIALHSADPSVHDSITRKSGSYAETTAALTKISSIVGVKSIAIQTVISRINYHNLRDLYRYCFEAYGITEFNITFPHPIGWAKNVNITPKYSDVSNDINAALTYCLNNNITPYLEAIPLCVFNNLNRAYAIEFYKQRAPNVVGFGGERDGHIDYFKANQEGYHYYKTCDNCRHRANCMGVWKEYIELYPEDNFFDVY